MAGLHELAPRSLSPHLETNSSDPITGPRLVVDPWDLLQASPYPSPHCTRAFHDGSQTVALSHQQRIREALLLIFTDPIPAECLRLSQLTQTEWQQALHWLDVSGLALYFLGRLEEENLTSFLPDWVYARLSQNLADNTERTIALLGESRAIHDSFQKAGLSYATLKGFSLGPLSVPRLEFRSQLDFDFLVAQSSAPEARRLLEERGFTLRSINGRSLEFGAHDERPMTLRDLYKPTPHRWVELHIEPDASPLLQRVQMRRLHGIEMPVLDPLDLFLGQGLHIYKHLRYEVTRPSHLLEFRRHVLARRFEHSFWHELHSRAALDPRHPIGLGVVILLIEHLMGPFAPPSLRRWSVDRLPLAVRVWVETLGQRAILVDPPGTKLYLLLQEALASGGIPASRSVRRALIPHVVPRPIRALLRTLHATRNPVGIDPGPRKPVRAYLALVARCLRFHLFEDLRYIREAHRFRKALSRLASV